MILELESFLMTWNGQPSGNVWGLHFWLIVVLSVDYEDKLTSFQRHGWSYEILIFRYSKPPRKNCCFFMWKLKWPISVFSNTVRRGAAASDCSLIVCCIEKYSNKERDGCQKVKISRIAARWYGDPLPRDCWCVFLFAQKLFSIMRTQSFFALTPRSKSPWLYDKLQNISEFLGSKTAFSLFHSTHLPLMKCKYFWI